MSPQELHDDVQKLAKIMCEQLESRFFSTALEKQSTKNLMYSIPVLRTLLLTPGGKKTIIPEMCDALGIDPAPVIDRATKAVEQLCDKLASAPTAALNPKDRLQPQPVPAPVPQQHAQPRQLSFLANKRPTQQSQHVPTAGAPADALSTRARADLMVFSEMDHAAIDAPAALRWWLSEGKKMYPELYLVACSVFGAFPVSAEAERQFSTAGKIMTPARAMLDPVWLRINSFIRLNMNMVVDATN